jgi:hypothetical protein
MIAALVAQHVRRGRVIPIKACIRPPPKHRWRAWGVCRGGWSGASIKQEVVLVSDRDGGYSEIPVLGVAK